MLFTVGSLSLALFSDDPDSRKQFLSYCGMEEVKVLFSR